MDKVKCKFYCGHVKKNQCCQLCNIKGMCGIACVNNSHCNGCDYIIKKQDSFNEEGLNHE